MNKKRLLTVLGGTEKKPLSGYSLWLSSLFGLSNPVSSWVDKSVNVNTVVQATADNQPAALSNGVDFDGINDSLAKTSPVLYEYESDVIQNGGFETYTGTADDGTIDVFTGWVNVSTPGSGVVEAVTTVHGGSAAVKVTQASGNGWLYQLITVVPGQKRVLKFWTRGDGSTAGRFRIYDNTNSADIVAYTSTGVAGTDYTFYQQIYTIPAGCTQVRLDFLNGAVASSSAYYDDVQDFELNDLSISFWFKRLVDGSALVRQYMFCRTEGVANRMWSFRFIGTGEGDDPNIGKTRFSLTKTGDSTASGANTSTVALINTWYHIAGTYQILTDGTSVIKVYVNGALETTVANAVAPIFYGTAPLSVGATSVVGSEHYFNGAIDEVLVYPSLLTLEQITAEYNRGKARHT